MIHQARDAGRLDLPHHGQHVRLEGVGCIPVRRLPGPLRVRQVGRVRVAELPAYGRHAERTALLETLRGAHENITLTAQELGVSRATLYRMLRRHSINLSRGLKAPPVVVESPGD